MRIILASTSPRRREILSLLQLPFDVIAPAFQEQSRDMLTAEQEVIAFALAKARSLPPATGSIVIGSDTLIELDGEKIGKPRDRVDAACILSKLSGRCHTILTGLAVVGPNGQPTLTHVERVHVEMVPFTEQQSADYVRLGESLDKAGAYSIQGLGAQLIAAIRGDYLAAVGLPLQIVARHLEELGIPPRIDVTRLYREKSFHNWKKIRFLE